MVDATVPYVTAYGNITKVLERIQQAQTPPRFSQDFLETKLGLKGGSARPLIPFLKRTGFLGSDGTPTELYKRFRNASHRGAAGAEALKTGYSQLYEVNEYLHDANDQQVRGVIVQVTGIEPKSSTVKAILGSFKALKGFARFDEEPAEDKDDFDEEGSSIGELGSDNEEGAARIKLGYTINLYLPATSDIAVFDAIFKSLRAHLL